MPPTGGTAQGGAGPSRYPELQAHHDAVYDRLTAGRPARAAGPLLDVGCGDGAALAATVEGTGIRGVALDRSLVWDWRGPAGLARVAGEASRLPFAAGAFAATLMQETWEWLSLPEAAVGEMARVSRGRVVIVQSDWRTLWIDSGDPDTAQEFTRLFAGPADPRLDAPATLLRDAGPARAGGRRGHDPRGAARARRLRDGVAAPATRVPGRAGGGGAGAPLR